LSICLPIRTLVGSSAYTVAAAITCHGSDPAPAVVGPADHEQAPGDQDIQLTEPDSLEPIATWHTDGLPRRLGLRGHRVPIGDAAGHHRHIRHRRHGETVGYRGGHVREGRVAAATAVTAALLPGGEVLIITGGEDGVRIWSHTGQLRHHRVVG